MNTETITIDGTATNLVPTGPVTWTASDIALRLRPNMTWSATRGDNTAIGDTAQTATDNLITAERKAQRAARIAARSTKGQIFAREMRGYLHIGARTRRFRSGSDLHAEILECVSNAAWNSGYYTPARQEAFREAFGAWMAYGKHIAGYRANSNVIAYVNDLSPHQFCNLLGEMVDAGISNVGEGERFFAQLAKRLYAQAA